MDGQIDRWIEGIDRDGISIEIPWSWLLFRAQTNRGNESVRSVHSHANFIYIYIYIYFVLVLELEIYISRDNFISINLYCIYMYINPQILNVSCDRLKVK